MSKFTRKHYRAIARVIRREDRKALDRVASARLVARAYERGRAGGISQLAGAIALMFRDDNPRFDENRFFHAIATGEGL